MSTTGVILPSVQLNSSSSDRVPWGSACTTCRRRKLKCDTVKPACGQCSRSNRRDECEYTNTNRVSKSSAAPLETLPQLERSFPGQSQHANPLPPVPEMPPMPYPPTLPEDPPADIAQLLLQHFLPHAEQVGFFLRKERFLAVATSLDEQQRTSKLSRALLDAVYLYGAHLSRIGTLMMHEPTLLARAARGVGDDLASKRYPVVQIIQAEVLLAHYFFCMGRLLEGKYHTSAAVALVLSARLHKIRSELSPAQDGDSLSDVTEDGIAEGEKINAFWTVFALDREWADVSGTPSPLYGQGSSPFTIEAIDTPWPLDTGDYDAVRTAAPYVRGSRTVYDFLHDLPSVSMGDTSFLALRAKAATLLERAARLSTCAPRLAGLRQTHAEEMQQLTGLIERFITSLPKMEASLEPHAVCHLLVIYTQAHVAMILLYRNSVEIPGTIPRRCLDAARAVSTQVIGPVDMQQLHYVDPILAPLWTIVVRVLFARMKPLGLLDAERDRARFLVERALQAITRFAFISPLMGMFL